MYILILHIRSESKSIDETIYKPTDYYNVSQFVEYYYMLILSFSFCINEYKIKINDIII